MAKGKWEVELDVKVPIAKYWETIKNSGTILPKIAPEFMASEEIIEGKPHEIGSVRLMKFGSAAPPGAFAKEKLISGDEAQYTGTFQEIEGGHLVRGFTFYETIIKLSPGPEPETTHVKWTANYEASPEAEKTIEELKKGSIKVFKGLEAYCLSTGAPK